MENHQVLSLTPADRPNLRVRQVGFELTDPYVEQCWGDRWAERHDVAATHAGIVGRAHAGHDHPDRAGRFGGPGVRAAGRTAG